MLPHLRDKALPAWKEEKEWKDGLSREVAKARGACGGDGWHGDEIAVLPTGAVRIFYEVSRSWRRNGVVPRKMRIFVQATMPKPGKQPTIANLRPFVPAVCVVAGFREWDAADVILQGLERRGGH